MPWQFVLSAIGLALLLPWGRIGAAAASLCAAARERLRGRGPLLLRTVAVLCLAAALLPVLQETWQRLQPEPAPAGPAHTAFVDFARGMADAWRESASLIEAGHINSDRAERDWLEARRREVQAAAFAPLAELEQQRLGEGRWTPTAAAALRREFAAQAEEVR